MTKIENVTNTAYLLLKLALVAGCGVMVLGAVAMVAAWLSRPDR